MKAWEVMKELTEKPNKEFVSLCLLPVNIIAYVKNGEIRFRSNEMLRTLEWYIED